MKLFARKAWKDLFLGAQWENTRNGIPMPTLVLTLLDGAVTRLILNSMVVPKETLIIDSTIVGQVWYLTPLLENHGLVFRCKQMTRCCWKFVEFMESVGDRRCRNLKAPVMGWFFNVSEVATKLLRGHGNQSHLTRESDCLSVRWGALCRAITHDRAYYGHRDDCLVNSQRILSALKYGSQGHPRFP